MKDRETSLWVHVFEPAAYVVDLLSRIAPVYNMQSADPSH